ncbi:ABC-F family ATP-binding cassette domain-containing protein [Croceimicrobium sp.]|uniref:ABC-F family ATP-binding cassette domain-containing protein n=1 Tax=Croceimicrobium sp. TaxID=2828340 RepID=UPI003BA874BC
MNYLSVENIAKAYGARKLFEGVSFGLAEGEKAALVARNGSGKTTLLRLLAGIEAPDTGRVTFRKGIRVEFLSQEPDLDPERSIIESVLAAENPMSKALIQYEEALENMEDTESYQRAFDAMERLKAWDFEGQVRTVLGKLGLHQVKQKIESLSGGQKKRVALAKILISSPDLLILDEPTNHLDLDMIEWLETYLSQKSMTLLMVTHDRYFLESVCDAILELEDAKLYRHPGNYSKFLERKSERQDVEAVNVDKARNLMRKELEWIRRQPKARGTKSKARIDAFDDIKKEASKDLREDQLQLNIKMTRLGSKILEVHKLKKSYGKKQLIENFNYVFKKGEKIGIAGANGSGKSTLLRMLTGLEEPSGGKIIIGETVQFGFYTQSGLELKEDKRVIDVVKDIAEYIPREGKGGDLSATQLLDRFLFDGDKQYTYVSKLSGGERRRLFLCTVLMANPNFLILDEPTNDLDILTLNVLEDFLMQFPGCVLVVTHDRYFMDKICDHLFAFEGEGQIKDFPGNYTEYRAAQAEEAAQRKLRNESMVKTKAKAAEKPKEKTKLTYAERLEFEALEGEIEDLETRRESLAAKLEAAATDADKIMEISSQLEELQAELEAKEMRWLELSEYAE